MNSHSLPYLAALGALVLAPACLPLGPAVLAQEMQHSRPSVRSSQLTITTSDGKAVTWTLASLAALPHHSVTVVNGHTKATETYSGIALSTLLAKAGVPQGEAVKGNLFLAGILAEGTDGYKVLYSLAEVDPALHTGEVIVADSVDGKDLGDHGALQLVSSEDKRPARWVRNLSAISVITAKP